MKDTTQSVDVEATRHNHIPKPLRIVFIILSIAGVVTAVYYHFFNIAGAVLIDLGYYYLLIAFYLTSAFLIIPARKEDRFGIRWYDIAAATLTFGLALYFFLHAWDIAVTGWTDPDTLNFTLAIIFGLLVLEGTRRAGGPIYAVICIVIGLYPLYAEHMPGILFGWSLPFKYLIGYTVFTAEGLLGIPTKVMGDILIGFLLFAAVLIASGAGKFFLNLALAILGGFRGGPAKVAVVGSGLFGSMSGSAMANVAGTGSVTIPAMKRIGYPPHYAAAIEACASVGGIVMPPVMGAIAFVMAMVLQMSYAGIIIAAAIPAVLYYFGLLVQVDAHAAKAGLKGIPREELPSIKATLKEGWVFIAVFVFLMWGLLYMRWEAMAPYYASALMVVLSFTSKETMLTPRRIIDTIVIAGRLITQVLAILLPIGFVIVGLVMSGVSASFTSGLVSVGGENILLTLFMGVVACYIIGMMGVGIAAYIFLAATMAPAVIAAGGLNELAVHLFIVYFAIVSGLTPPVAVVAFLAATMAGAPAMKTGWTCMRLGAVIYFIPFFFVFNPALVLQGSIFESFYLFVLCLLGILILAGALEGYLLKIGRLNLWTRPLLIAAGALIAFPEWKTTIVGAVLTTVVLAIILVGRHIRAEKLLTSA